MEARNSLECFPRPVEKSEKQKFLRPLFLEMETFV